MGKRAKRKRGRKNARGLGSDKAPKGEEKTKTKKRAGAGERQGSEGRREKEDEKTRRGWGETRRPCYSHPLSRQYLI